MAPISRWAHLLCLSLTILTNETAAGSITAAFKSKYTPIETTRTCPSVGPSRLVPADDLDQETRLTLENTASEAVSVLWVDSSQIERTVIETMAPQTRMRLNTHFGALFRVYGTKSQTLLLEHQVGAVEVKVPPELSGRCHAIPKLADARPVRPPGTMDAHSTVVGFVSSSPECQVMVHWIRNHSAFTDDEHSPSSSSKIGSGSRGERWVADLVSSYEPGQHMLVTHQEITYATHKFTFRLMDGSHFDTYEVAPVKIPDCGQRRDSGVALPVAKDQRELSSLFTPTMEEKSMLALDLDKTFSKNTTQPRQNASVCTTEPPRSLIGKLSQSLTAAMK